MKKSCKNCKNSYLEMWHIGEVVKCHFGLNRLSKYNPQDTIRDVGFICASWKREEKNEEKNS